MGLEPGAGLPVRANFNFSTMSEKISFMQNNPITMKILIKRKNIVITTIDNPSSLYPGGANGAADADDAANAANAGIVKRPMKCKAVRDCQPFQVLLPMESKPVISGYSPRVIHSGFFWQSSRVSS